MSRKSGGKTRSQKHFARGVTRHNLLTFGRHDPGGLPSDDSEDSDYEPSDEEKMSSSKKKRKRDSKSSTSRKVAKKLKKTDEPAPQPKSRSTCYDWSDRIPNELLHKVFMYGVHSFTAVPFLCRVSQVCQKWHAVASDPSLWFKIDLTFMASLPKAKDETLNALKQQEFLKSVKSFNFTGWEKLTSAGLEVVATQCKELTSLNLFKCKRVTSRAIPVITSHLKELTSINLSYVETDATSNMSIKNLLHEQGRQLTALYLAGNKSIGTPSLVSIQSFCGNLKVLDLSSTSVNNLHVERLQAGCPKLVELRLSQLSLLPSTVRANQINESRGFPDLELLSLASITGGEGTDDLLLQRLLKTSSKLRQLDLRGCEKITHRAFLNLPVVSLEQLFLSRCKISWKELFKIIKERWKESLKELDVSWGHYLNDVSLLTLTATQTPVLAVLNLAGSGVSAVALRSIVDSCQNLTELNLTSCRGVPRGLKQLHDAKSISKLRTQLQSSPDQVEVDPAIV